MFQERIIVKLNLQLAGSMKKAVTLVELLLAVALLGTILLAVGVFELASLRMYHKQSYGDELFSEAVFVIAHLNKYMQNAIGDKNSQGIKVNWTSLCRCTTAAGSSCNCYVEIRNDVNNTPSDYSDDVIRRYAYDGANYELRFYPNYGSSPNQYSVLSKKVVECKFSFDIDLPQIFKIDKLKLRYDPKKEVSQDNPEMEISSINLFSFSHSLN